MGEMNNISPIDFWGFQLKVKLLREKTEEPSAKEVQIDRK
jgi:hypothetical protein